MVNKKITYSLSMLKSLIDKSDSCVICLENCKRSFSYSSATYKDVKTMFAEYLNSQVTTYDQSLGGIILSEKNVRISPFVQINEDEIIRRTYWADIYIFKPTVGGKLKGHVSKKTADHLGVLVHSVFNVSIPRPESSSLWSGALYKIGDAITFEVEKIIFKANLPYIRGKLLDISDPDCENNKKGKRKLSSICEELSDTEHRPKKKKKISLELSSADPKDSTDSASILECTIDNLINLEKKKRKKSNSILNVDQKEGLTNHSIDDSVDIEKKEKKKRKKSSLLHNDTEEMTGVNIKSEPIDSLTDDTSQHIKKKKKSLELSSAEPKDSTDSTSILELTINNLINLEKKKIKKSNSILNGDQNELTDISVDDSVNIAKKEKKKHKKSSLSHNNIEEMTAKSEPIDSSTEDTEYVKKKKKSKKSVEESEVTINSKVKSEPVSTILDDNYYDSSEKKRSSILIHDIQNGLTSSTDLSEITRKPKKKSKKSSLLLNDSEGITNVKVKSEIIDSPS